jgi:hypothetical protein
MKTSFAHIVITVLALSLLVTRDRDRLDRRRPSTIPGQSASANALEGIDRMFRIF